MCEVSHLDQLWHQHVCRVSDAYFELKDTPVISFMMCIPLHIASSETDCNFIILDMHTCWFFFF